MFTVTFVLYESPAMDRQESLSYWRTTHAGIVGRVPGVQRYVQQHAVAAPDGPPPFLGVASLSFADQAAFEAAAGSPEFSAAVADVANFADGARLPTAFTEEVVIVG
ncbi:EthD family reductase [Nocardioides alkalitolerans]|uniref:EthD family reductase n=1 Tax=Nocardioides alkalitolerans TaxID=281714 RepID=UPI000418E363|nr:EthD family reductase [Nocardioides alkalitolerans]